jgi:hypothetical protein
MVKAYERVLMMHIVKNLSNCEHGEIVQQSA